VAALVLGLLILPVQAVVVLVLFMVQVEHLFAPALRLTLPKVAVVVLGRLHGAVIVAALVLYPLVVVVLVHVAAVMAAAVAAAALVAPLQIILLVAVCLGLALVQLHKQLLDHPLRVCFYD
jgi:hypothetical protein